MCQDFFPHSGFNFVSLKYVIVSITQPLTNFILLSNFLLIRPSTSQLSCNSLMKLQVNNCNQFYASVCDGRYLAQDRVKDCALQCRVRQHFELEGVILPPSDR